MTNKVSSLVNKLRIGALAGGIGQAKGRLDVDINEVLEVGTVINGGDG